MGSVRARSGAVKGKCPSGAGADPSFTYSFLLLAPLQPSGKGRGGRRVEHDVGRPASSALDVDVQNGVATSLLGTW